MTEETPKKKPRRKRRTKAQIEADKAAELAVQSPIKEPQGVPTEPDPEDEDRCIPCEESAAAALEAAEAVLEKESASEEPLVAKEEPAKGASPVESSPVTYANPNMERIANRFKRTRAERRAARSE